MGMRKFDEMSFSAEDAIRAFHFDAKAAPCLLPMPSSLSQPSFALSPGSKLREKSPHSTTGVSMRAFMFTNVIETHC